MLGSRAGARLDPLWTLTLMKTFLRTALVGLAAISPAGCSISPSPFTNQELQNLSESSSARVTANQESFAGPVTLYEAMARALKYNLDFKVEIMQQSLRGAELRLSHYNLLPSAVANSGYVSRDSYLSTGEHNLKTNVDRPPTTTSYEQKLRTADFTFSWNILDFGLSYIRARQAADKVLIAEEAKRKVIQRVIEDVRTAFWRAVSAERMLSKLAALETRTKTVLANTRRLYVERETSPITALTYERELVEITRTTEELARELSVAKAQLAALMNVTPDTPFTLAETGSLAQTPILDVDEKEMIETALINRAELRDVTYQKRINRHEAHAALLELLPGIQLYAGQNYDTNKYLENNRWVTWGAKASWNVMRIFQYPAKRTVIDAQDDLLDARTLALTMAIMTQVHVSRIRYAFAARELVTAREYNEVQQRLLKQMRNEAVAGRISEQTLVREEMNALVAEAKRDIAFSALQNAFANVFASTGLDPYGSDFDVSEGVHDVAIRLKALWIERGDFGAKHKIVIAQQANR